MKRTPAKKKRSEAERKQFFAIMERFCQIALLLPEPEDIDTDDAAQAAEVKVVLAELAEVVKAGKVVGIVSRANLIQALASIAKPGLPEVKADDASVRERMLAQFRAQPWTKPWMLNFVVHDGIVDL